MIIPKLIHLIWLGEQPLHPLMNQWRCRWKELHPDWEVLLWTDRTGVSMVRSNHLQGEAHLAASPEHNSLLAQACHLSQRSNIWRYLIMNKFGGLYVDTDVEPFKPVDDVVGNLTAFAAKRQLPPLGTWLQKQEPVYECAFFGAVPDHPWLRHLVNNLQLCDPAVSLSMGCGYFTRVTKEHPEVCILDTQLVLFEPPDDWEMARECGCVPDVGKPVATSIVAKHHWSSTWFERSFRSLK